MRNRHEAYTIQFNGGWDLALLCVSDALAHQRNGSISCPMNMDGAGREFNEQLASIANQIPDYYAASRKPARRSDNQNRGRNPVRVSQSSA